MEKIHHALFFHCSSQKLNLVTNDLNSEIRRVGLEKEVGYTKTLRNKMLVTFGTPCIRNYRGKEKYQLHATASKSSCILYILLITKYSAWLEPVVNVFKSMASDAAKAPQHIKRILQLPKNFGDATIVEERNGLEEDMAFALSNIVGRQCYRNNHPAENPPEFRKRFLIFRRYYMDDDN
nr:unnamed protein product [Callosobruchus chinensis]